MIFGEQGIYKGSPGWKKNTTYKNPYIEEQN